MKNRFTPAIALIALALFLAGGVAWAAKLIVPAGARVKVNAATIVIPGEVNNAGTIETTTGRIKLTGNWANSGTFTSGWGTVEFAGSSGEVQTISGRTTFYNFLSTSAGLTLSFEAFATAGATQEVTNRLRLVGQPGLLLKVRSTISYSQAHLKPSGSREVSYVDVKDSRNTTAALINPANSTDSGNNTNWFYGDIAPPSTPEALTAEALPVNLPTYVRLSWKASTDEVGGSGLAGYNIYRAISSEAGSYTKIKSLVTTTSTNDTTVTKGNDYYYKITAQDNSTNESGYSGIISAPLLALTREVLVASPAGYTGGSTDPVPGATVTFNLYYTNVGFAKATQITIVDDVPTNLNYKMRTASGESIASVAYSSNEASSWNYSPSGIYIDAAVTDVKWLCTDLSSGATRKVWYGTVIK